MYSLTDILNILSATERCPEEKGDRICTNVKKGKTSFSTKDINQYQDLEYLLSRDFLSKEAIKLLIDRIQDICCDCTFTTITDPSVSTDDCDEDNIITEDGICITTEDNINIVNE